MAGFLKLFLRFVLFCVGMALLVFLIRKVGPDELWSLLNRLGWRSLFVLYVPFVWLFFQTKAWQLTVEEAGTHLTFWELLRVKVSGDAANTFTPLGFLGGDPVRYSMLKKRMPSSATVASVVLDRTMQSAAVISLLVLSLILAAFFLNLPPAWRITFPVVTCIMVVLLFFFVHHQQKGMFEKFFRKLHKLGVKTKTIESILHHLVEIDHRIVAFYRHDKKRFWTCYLYHFMGRFMGVIEIYVIAWVLSIPLTLLGALFMASLAVLVNILFVFIPGSMGIMEGAYGALCLLLGLDPVSGVAIQLVRRLRAIVWISLGVIFMLFFAPRAKTK